MEELEVDEGGNPSMFKPIMETPSQPSPTQIPAKPDLTKRQTNQALGTPLVPPDDWTMSPINTADLQTIVPVKGPIAKIAEWASTQTHLDMEREDNRAGRGRRGRGRGAGGRGWMVKRNE